MRSHGMPGALCTAAARSQAIRKCVFMTDHTKPGVAFWATVMVVVLLVAYPLSIGPISWLADHGFLPDPVKQPLRYFYYPLAWAVLRSGAAYDIYTWYVRLWGHELRE